MKFPRISVVTPSYNQGNFIEETIQSVLDQNYPELEYIIIDGNSQDETLKIIKRYESHLAYWVSEPDRGQTHAINKGLSKSSGEIWLYLNSDDLLVPGALHHIAEIFQDPEINWVGGQSDIFDQTGTIGTVLPRSVSHSKEYLTFWNSSSDQALFPCSNVSFMRRSVIETCGLFDESYHYGMDIEYYLRAIFVGKFKLHITPEVLGKWRWHPESKSLSPSSYLFIGDEIKTALAYLQYLKPDLARRAALREIWDRQKFFAVREALYYKDLGKTYQALNSLWRGLKQHRSILWYRPWLGALRRLLLP